MFLWVLTRYYSLTHAYQEEPGGLFQGVKSIPFLILRMAGFDALSGGSLRPGLVAVPSGHSSRSPGSSFQALLGLSLSPLESATH